MTGVRNLSRRGFLKLAGTSGGLVLGVTLTPATRLLDAVAAPAGAAEPSAALAPSVYLSIGADGAVTIVAHRSEMGQGIRTGLPQVVADELEADWQRVTVTQADGDPRYGSQNTDGSRSVRNFYQAMREAGATARQMLEQAAADTWQVDAGECRARNHEVVHEASGRRLGFGELAARAAKLEVPDPSALRFKKPQERRLVGKPVPIVDLDDIVHGRAVYGIDLQVPGMKHASIERCPVLYGKVKSYDDSEALKVPGVERVVEIPAVEAPPQFKPWGGLAVIASNTWSAQQGRKKLKIEWDLGPNASYDSEAYRRTLEATARRPGRVVRRRGDAASVLAGADRVVRADYYAPHMSQAPMEPMAAVASVTEAGCEVWACTQRPQGAVATVAGVLGIDKEKVTVHVSLLGGGFGRKSKADFIAEAAFLSRQVGAPVKVTWTREDDTRHGYYHSVSVQHAEAALDADGRPTAWLQRTVFPPIVSTFQADAREAGALEMGLGFVDMPWDVPALQLENGEAQAHVRIGWLRSVANVYHAYATCSFADELAAAAGRDPLEYLRELIGERRHIDLTAEGVEDPFNYGESLDTYPVDTGRLRAVLDLVAERGEWGRPVPDGHGLGIACHRSFLTYTAAIVQVAVGDDNSIRVPRVDIAIDCGLIVNPDRVRSQMEGSVVYGLSAALFSRITARDGRIQQSNFNDYLVPRISDMPEVRVHLTDSQVRPTGVGEPGVPPVAPALANAVFAATGKRVREIPITPELLAAADGDG